MSYITIFKIISFGASCICGVLGVVTKTHEEKTVQSPIIGGPDKTDRKLTRAGKIYIGALIGALVIAFLLQVFESREQESREADAKKTIQEQKATNIVILVELKEQKATNAAILAEVVEQKRINASNSLAFSEQLQKILTELGAAEQSDAKRIAVEKIRVLQKDISGWALTLTTNFSQEKDSLQKTKEAFEQGQLDFQLEETKKEIQFSQKSYPIVNFAKSYLEEMVRAYAKQSGKKILIEDRDLPKNFFTNSWNYEIKFEEGAVWRIGLSSHERAIPPWPIEGREMTFSIDFINFQKRSVGKIIMRIFPSHKLLAFRYEAAIPSPNPELINKGHDLLKYESEIQDVFQQVISVQLLQTEK